MKVVLINPEEGKAQDLNGLKSYLHPYQHVEIEEKNDHLRVRCPTNFVNAIVSLVEKYGYWASEIQDTEQP